MTSYNFACDFCGARFIEEETAYDHDCNPDLIMSGIVEL